MKKILCALFSMFFVVAASLADDSKSAIKCFEWDGDSYDTVLRVFFNNNESVFPTINGEGCSDALKKEFGDKITTGKEYVYLVGSTSQSGNWEHNAELAKKRVATVKSLLNGGQSTKPMLIKEFVGGETDAFVNNRNNHRADDRAVIVIINPNIENLEVQKIESEINKILGLYAKINMDYSSFFNADRSVWKNEDGEFNTARLLSDSIAGVVLGTAGGLVTANVVKKNQLAEGFEDLRCTVGGQTVADWGDEFSVGRIQ